MSSVSRASVERLRGVARGRGWRQPADVSGGGDGLHGQEGRIESGELLHEVSLRYLVGQGAVGDVERASHASTCSIRCRGPRAAGVCPTPGRKTVPPRTGSRAPHCAQRRPARAGRPHRSSAARVRRCRSSSRRSPRGARSTRISDLAAAMNATSTPGIESRARTRSSAAASMSGSARDGSAKQSVDDPLHGAGRRQPRTASCASTARRCREARRPGTVRRPSGRAGGWAPAARDRRVRRRQPCPGCDASAARTPCRPSSCRPARPAPRRPHG